jgi:hypothetical protein
LQVGHHVGEGESNRDSTKVVRSASTCGTLQVSSSSTRATVSVVVAGSAARDNTATGSDGRRGPGGHKR